MRVLLLAVAIACSACAQVPAQDVDFSTSCSRLGERGSAAMRWYRSSAESRALFLQAFRLASDRLAQLARGRAPGTWAVVADGDDTLLDTSEFQCELEASRDGKFDPALWDQWVATSRATGTPGAADFVRLVRSLGGRLIVVSNRAEPKHRAATLANFAALGMAPDQLLLASGSSDKNERFRSIATPVVMYLGDNIEDFPGMKQASGAGGEIGTVFIVMPNPIYGSWTRNPLR